MKIKDSMLTHFDSNWASHYYQGHHHSHTSAVKKVELANEFNIFPICSDCWRRLEFSESRASAKLQMWYLLLWWWWRCSLLKKQTNQRNKQIKEINRQANKKRVTGECKTTNVILGPCCYDEDGDNVLFQIAKQTKQMQLMNKQKNKQTNSDSWTGENVIFSATLMKKRFVWHKLCPFPNRTIKSNKAKKETNKQTNKQKASHGPVQNYKCYPRCYILWWSQNKPNQCNW